MFKTSKRNGKASKQYRDWLERERKYRAGKLTDPTAWMAKLK